MSRKKQVKRKKRGKESEEKIKKEERIRGVSRRISCFLFDSRLTDQFPDFTNLTI